ncbi:MAG: VOC family protein [Candidatus Nanopelagicales bacterium]|jgi:predicted enzyme related to lactoylglutathione lyase
MAGSVSFFELGAPDAQKAREFYGELFDWVFHEIGDTGQTWIEIPVGLLRAGVHGGDPDTGIEVYFGVPDIDIAVNRVRELGGEAPDAGKEEPGFGRFSRCKDNQGVRFGLHEAPIAR